MLAEAAKREDVVAVSALTGEGIGTLIDKVAALLTEGHRRYTIKLDPSDGAGAAWLHQHGDVVEHWMDDDQAVYEVRMAPRDHERFGIRGG